MLNSRQRAQLRALANSLETIVYVGKGGIDPALIDSVEKAVLKRELIKGRVLENSGYTSREAAGIIAEHTGCDVVQVIGTRFVLYRKNKDEPKIRLVK